MRDQAERIFQKRPDLNAEFIAHAREHFPKLFPELQQQPEQQMQQEPEL